jgi:hypothetical protein
MPRPACHAGGSRVRVPSLPLQTSLAYKAPAAAGRARRSFALAPHVLAKLQRLGRRRSTVANALAAYETAVRLVVCRDQIREAADAGSIPAASTLPANGDCGLEHLAPALLKLEEGLSQVGRIQLRVAGRRADVRMTEQKLRQPEVVVGTL